MILFKMIFGIVMITVLSIPAWAADVGDLIQFESGNTAVAADVNTNFNDVKSAVNTKQDQVINTCNPGQSIRVINPDGSVVCEDDSIGGDISGVTAGSGLTGGGETGPVTLNVGAGTGITVNADNIALDPTAIDGRYVNEGQANSVTAGMAAFNYAGSTSEGGAATNLSCTGCVSQSELSFTPGDITGVTAGTHLSGGGSSGSVALSVSGMPGD